MKKVDKVINNLNQDSLNNSFYEACQDKDFYQFLASLKSKEEVLKKYTSSLKDSYIEKSNCVKCKSLANCKNEQVGYCYLPEVNNNSISFSYIACDKYNDYLKKTKYLKNIEYFKMPKELKEASFKNLYKDDKKRVPIIKYFKEFIDLYNKEDKPKGIYLTGSFGSGKTYLIAVLFNEMAKRGVKGAMIYYPELLRSLKSSFNSDYEEKFNYIKKVPLLLLDDIGSENVTAWSRDEVLGPILQYRMEDNLPTFFTSNLTQEELENNMVLNKTSTEKVKARRIIERIKYLTSNFSLISENLREK